MPDNVKLPKEIAKAMDNTFTDMDDEQVSCILHNIIGCPVYHLNEQAATIKEYFSDGKWMLLMKALVNGYEVEQTPEDKVKEKYDSCICSDDRKYRGMAIGIQEALTILNIKIEGVNA